MKPLFLFLLLSSLLLTPSTGVVVQPGAKINSRITVMGVVYCDICFNNTFSTHSYFIPGVEVSIDCKFKALSPKTSVDGIKCAEDSAVESSCQATLAWTSSSSCNILIHFSSKGVFAAPVVLSGMLRSVHEASNPSLKL